MPPQLIFSTAVTASTALTSKETAANASSAISGSTDSSVPSPFRCRGSAAFTPVSVGELLFSEHGLEGGSMLLAKRHLLLPETLPYLGDLGTLHLGQRKKLHQRHPDPLTTPSMSVRVESASRDDEYTDGESDVSPHSDLFIRNVEKWLQPAVTWTQSGSDPFNVDRRRAREDEGLGDKLDLEAA